MTVNQDLTPEHWRELGELFDQLVALPPDERNDSGLKQSHSPAVRDLLERMLAAHDSDDPQLLDQTVQAVAGSLLAGPSERPILLDYRGRKFGPWRVLEEIGRGGMAVVLKGERADGQFEKEVAVKLLPQAGSQLEQQRLIEEMRILARLEHPNIARLIDGGISDGDGIPYLVMEYVNGCSLTDYCRHRQLDQGERARLFLEVLDAVQYAHRNLVVHCDIKPDNILVTGDGRVRLVDFGVANLLSPGRAASLDQRGLMCSPAYAAPEQLRGEPPAISHDIFSLGAVLFELLTEQRLRDNRSATRLLFSAATPKAEPARPSDIDPRVDRDLDAICLTALSPDPDDRYYTANAMLKEIERWQHREPVLARGGGRLYLLGRFMARNRLALAATMMLFIIGTAGVAATLWQAHEAQAQAEKALVESQRAQTAQNFIVQLFEANDPDIARGNPLTVREVLDLGSQQVSTTFSGTPDLNAEMLSLLGRLYRHLGEYQAARPLLEDAVAIAREANHPALIANTLSELGQLENVVGNHRAAIELLNHAERIMLDAGMVPGVDHAQLINRLVFALGEAGRSGDGFALAEAALESARTNRQLGPEALWEYLRTLARAQLHRGAYEQSEQLVREALALEHPSLGAPSRSMAALTVLAASLHNQGRGEEALRYRRQVLELAETVLPPIHRSRALALSNLAATLLDMGILEEAESVLYQALASLVEIYPGGEHPRLWATHNNLGLLLLDLERYSEAEPHLQRSLELAEKFFGEGDLRFATANANLGSLLAETDRTAEAERLIQRALAVRLDVLGEDHNLVGASLSLLAWLRLIEDRASEALELTAKALATYERSASAHARFKTAALTRHARALFRLGRIDEAAASFEAAMALARQADLSSGLAWHELLVARAEFLLHADPGRANEAIDLALVAHQQTFGDNHPAVARLRALTTSPTSTTGQ